jgi:chromatin remodeling complex protein RSC6
MSSGKSSRRSAKAETAPEPVTAPAPTAPAPVVEAAAVVVEHAEEVNETYESVMTVLREKMAARDALDKEVRTLLKSLDRLHVREVKVGGKSKRSHPKKDRAPSGFAKATAVPEPLRKFLKLGADVELPRTEVAKQIYSYVREQNLRDKDDRRIIHPDASIRKLFSLKEGETLDFKNFQKQLSKLYPKSAGKVEEAAAAVTVTAAAVVADVATVVADAAAEAPTGSKRRSRAATTTA